MILSSEPAEEKKRLRRHVVVLIGAAAAALAASFAALYLAPDTPASAGLAVALSAAGGIAAGASLLLWLVVVPIREARRQLGRYAAGQTDIRIDESQGIPPFRALARTLNALADRTSDRELQYALVAEATGDVIWEWTAASNRIAWTGQLSEYFGVASDRFEAELPWWHERVHPQDRDLVEQGLADMGAGTARHWSAEYRFRHQDGSYRWFWDRGVMIRDANGQPQRFIGCMTDISARRKAEERIWQLANHDELTGLPNRKVFHSQLNTLTETDSKACCALLLIDIDHFKDVNDSLGHPAGDALLRAVADRLKHSAGEAAEVFRLGGDEFGILLPQSDRQASTALAARVLAALRDPVIVAERVLSTRATIGIVLFPDHGSDPAELLQNADLALYEGKSRGRNQAVYFEPSLRAALERRITLLGEVREGVAQGRFAPYYQPIVSLRTGAVQGVEALMRWQHPDRGLLTPYSFLAAYDDAELALQLGTRLMECVLADYRRLEGAGLAPPYIAVNLSSAVARIPDFPDRLLGWLAEGGMPASRLGVELTETLLFGEHAELIGSMVAKLHAAGVRIALDDFGTGYASLTHLQKFPVDTIKIDQSFVRSIGTDAGSQAITSAVLELGRRLGMAVVAEGVETAEHAEILRAAGCRQAQGYHFARPMPADALVDYMAAQAETTGLRQAKAG